MATQKERFLKYLQKCVKSTRSTDSNPLFLAGNAPKDYARFLEPDRLFDYNPSKWESTGSLYAITDYDKAKEIFDELISDEDFRERDKNDNSGWRKGAISHYVCFLSAEKFFSESPSKLREDIDPDKTPAILSELPLQQIFYGAPGTGKSHSVEEVCKEYTHFRTTFHPDSDYSTFVGCYKPTMINGERIYNSSELISKLTEIKNTGTSYPCHKFASKYWESLKDLSTAEIKDILSACGFTDSMNVEISKGIAIGQYMASNVDSKKIAYSFVPQAFIKAYIEAWKDLSNPVFLIIEEINRGNCAQIFGDLFQLLDRNEQGYSSYEIEADSDLQQYIASQGLSVEELVDNDENPIEDKLNNGEILCLPPNLYIWATMNTSDQSLFPIDSAFKRRWDWKYVPINTEAKSGWKIVVDGKNYSWSSFLDKINDEIDTTTSSEDKQLGFFFCKADDTDEDDNNGTISAEKFVGKVLFYIYNDVFKDYGLDQEFFKDKENAGKKISFRSLFQMNGDINETQVAKILDNLGVEKLDLNSDAIADEEEKTAGGAHKHLKSVTFPDGTKYSSEDGLTRAEIYVNALKKIGIGRVEPLFNTPPLPFHRENCPIISATQSDAILNSKRNKYQEVDGMFVVTTVMDDTKIKALELIKEELSENFEIAWD